VFDLKEKVEGRKVRMVKKKKEMLWLFNCFTSPDLFFLNFIIHVCQYKFYLGLYICKGCSNMKTRPSLRCIKLINLTSSTRLFPPLNQ